MSYQERMEGLQRRADIASSRANPERRQMARDSMRNFFGKLFKGGNKKAKGGGRQYFGSSPLQQAIAQRDAGGLITPQAQELLRGMEMNPEEMARQEALMAQGRHGDYGINRQAQPYYTDATTQQLSGDQQGPSKSLAKADGTANISANVEAGNVEAVKQAVTLKHLINNPSKLNTEGVKSMQTMLNTLGFRDKDGAKLSVDGKMGPLTASAIDRWKADHSTDTGGALDSVKVVRGFNQNNVAGAEEGAFSPRNQWNPYAMETQSQWDIVNQGHGGKGQEAGYFDIQDTIGNPANSPVMWGANDLMEATNPLQYDRESEEVLPPYR